MARQIKYAFGLNGDRLAIADEDALDPGIVSYDRGYPVNYQLQLGVDADAKAIERNRFNSIIYDATDNIKQWQEHAFPEWYSATTYAKGAIVYFTDGNSYISKDDGNIASPTDTDFWELFKSPSQILENVPMEYKGNLTSTIDFNLYIDNGFYDLSSDASVNSSANRPSGAVAGILEVKSITSTPNNIVIQRYTDRNSVIFLRARNAAGAWSSWLQQAAQKDIFSINLPNVDSSVDWNTLITSGTRQVTATTVGTNAPPLIAANLSGILNVYRPNDGTILYQDFQTVTSGLPRYSRISLDSGTTWQAWAPSSISDLYVKKAGDTITGTINSNFSGSALSQTFDTSVSLATINNSKSIIKDTKINAGKFANLFESPSLFISYGTSVNDYKVLINPKSTTTSYIDIAAAGTEPSILFKGSQYSNVAWGIKENGELVGSQWKYSINTVYGGTAAVSSSIVKFLNMSAMRQKTTDNLNGADAFAFNGVLCSPSTNAPAGSPSAAQFGSSPAILNFRTSENTAVQLYVPDSSVTNVNRNEIYIRRIQFSGTTPESSSVTATSNWTSISGTPAGSIMIYGGQIAPEGWLMCDGAEYNRDDYPILFSIIGTTNGSSSSTTFKVPDARGKFIRGLDNGAGVDSEPTRTIGSYQNDTIRNITGSIFVRKSGEGILSKSGAFNNSSTSSDVTAQHSGGSSPCNLTIDFNASNSVPTSNENRPKNIAFNYIIKY